MKLQEIITNDSEIHFMAVDSVLASEIQTCLIGLGCLDPPADGKFGAVTKFVLRNFAKLVGIDDFEDVINAQLASSLLEETPDNLFGALDLGDDFASRIIKYMQLKDFWIARMPNFRNIVYVEGANEDGAANEDTHNHFNDRRIVFVIDKDGKPEVLLNSTATTEPGKYWTDNPMNPNGAARIAFGQFKAWVVGTHKAGSSSAHEALTQSENLPVHRDKNKDTIRTGDIVDVGVFGINQHSGWDAPVNDIGLHGAGCLVGRSKQAHRDFMKICKKDPRYKDASNGYKFMSTIIAGDDLAEQFPVA
jgi:hypothetical protein